MYGCFLLTHNWALDTLVSDSGIVFGSDRSPALGVKILLSLRVCLCVLDNMLKMSLKWF